jgi:hypothetical protein
MARTLSFSDPPSIPPMITFTDKGILRKTRQAKITERVSEMENIWKEGRKRRETTGGK